MASTTSSPIILSHPLLMKDPNEPISIHRGSYTLVKGKDHIQIEGEIHFTWYPSLGIKFSGTITGSETEKAEDFLETQDQFEVEFEGLKIGKGTLLSYTLGHKSKVYGRVADPAVVGNKSTKVDKVLFTVPNLMEFRGEKVKYSSSTTIGFNRLIFEDQDYVITLDKTEDYKERMDKLEQKGGFIGLYSGEIRRVNGKLMTFDEISTLSYKFSTFLSFLNGKRTAAMFCTGFLRDAVIWQDYSRKVVEQHFHVHHWPYTTKTELFNSLWQSFSELWKDKDHQYFLETAINWYIEANTNKVFVESRIMLAQTNLELLYNWLVIEKLGMLEGKDSAGIAAANKIRLLLSTIKVPKQIPKDFTSLLGAEKAKDGPEIITIIRNAIVHSQEEKRRKLKAMSPDVKIEALYLSLWYVELSLLFILDYKGVYINRCKKAPSVVAAGGIVPWAKA